MGDGHANGSSVTDLDRRYDHGFHLLDLPKVHPEPFFIADGNVIRDPITDLDQLYNQDFNLHISALPQL